MNNYWLEKHPFFYLNNLEEIYNYVFNYSSPSFLYSRKVITHQYNNLRKSIPENFEIFYAQKSNPYLKILEHINSLKAGCDTASEGEVKSAFKAKFSRDRIMLTGPAKNENELRYAIDNNLLSINVESLQELILLDKLCAEYGKRQNVLIRINPKFEAGETNKIIGGMGVSKFGIDIDFIPQVFEHSKKLRNIAIKGIHIFNSSQILDWKRIYYNIKNVIETAIRFSEKYKLDFDLIDAGGGLGIPYSLEEKYLNLELLGNYLHDLMDKPRYKNFLSRTKIILEPGRFLSGLAGIYLTKVLYTKKSCGKKIVLTDGGINHLLRPALIGHKHSILNLSAINEGRKEVNEYIIAGPLCTSLDQFDDSAILNETKPNDILAVLNAGAYGFTESMPLFLSHKPAKEIFIN
jgi:diaminopimelate decarboxylase